ncbi:hypothetical protein ABZ797_38845 [Streptomyces antimycoticus]|uniref:hypothetical protein n=1 Tax=Streptomyces antimycoticus TaxID=68175 RepID=UPI0034020F36|nr:hypothetical protein OG546_47765 [Streptomyces antimycoticus]
MAKRAVHRRARKIVGEEPVALVWCEIHKPIPMPSKEVHRAAGRGRLKPGLDQARVEGEAGQPCGFATFRLRFADSSWLEAGRLGESEDADHFLRTING